MYLFLVNLFQYIRWLSLDIALGGAILLLYVSKELYKIDVPSVLVLLLVDAILIIYTLDHLTDARRVEHPTMQRHLFHKSYEKSLIYYLVCLAIVGCIGLFFLELEVIIAGAVMAGISGTYLLINRRLAEKGSKEFIVAMVYASAMFVYPLVKLSLSLFDLLYWMQLFFLALINLLIISYFEHHRDTMDKTTSIAHVMGIVATRRTSYLLLAFNILLSIMLLSLERESTYHVFVLVASLVLLVVLQFEGFFEVKERYRFACDAVFLIPIFLL